jgi:hypothetical protein
MQLRIDDTSGDNMAENRDIEINMDQKEKL